MANFFLRLHKSTPSSCIFFQGLRHEHIHVEKHNYILQDEKHIVYIIFTEKTESFECFIIHYSEVKSVENAED